ncbi:MAG: hypothetical protein ABSG65_02765 [Bryobacteraceae bacterium]|jgi:hypothetical protein
MKQSAKPVTAESPAKQVAGLIDGKRERCQPQLLLRRYIAGSQQDY